jgi:hypothetical protein
MHLYESQYARLKIERAGLFKALREKYPCKDVLYPGCSVHITPSLYFPHVVYVDESETAAQFFADKQSILEFVNRNKHYKQSAYLRYIQQDYSKSLPLKEGTFDLLLALFAGGIAKSCARYLKPGGLLLTNNHQGDAMDAVNDHKFIMIAVVQFHKATYTISEKALDKMKISAPKTNQRYLKQASQGIEYVENETYYVFERSRYFQAEPED